MSDSATNKNKATMVIATLFKGIKAKSYTKVQIMHVVSATILETTIKKKTNHTLDVNRGSKIVTKEKIGQDHVIVGRK